MSARMLVELPSGHKVLFGGRGSETGLAEVSAVGDLAGAAGEKLQEALGALTSLVESVEQSISGMARKPDTFEIEFGAKMSSGCDLWIVSGDGEAELRVKVCWGKGD